MKKIISGIMLTLLVIGTLFNVLNIKPIEAQATTILEVIPKIIMRPIGSSFTIRINIVNVVNLISVTIYLRYDPSVLGSWDGAICFGEMWPGGGCWKCSSIEGVLGAGTCGVQGTPKTGSGTLLTIAFGVNGHGSSKLDIYGETLGGSMAPLAMKQLMACSMKEDGRLMFHFTIKKKSIIAGQQVWKWYLIIMAKTYPSLKLRKSQEPTHIRRTLMS
jgi:hypothetical protein